MPLVTVTLLRGRDAAFRRAILDGVHGALVASGVPATDRFQRVLQLDPDDFVFDPTLSRRRRRRAGRDSC